MAPWKGPRHRTVYRDTNIATVMFVVIFGTYVAWEIVGEAPQGLVSLLGVAGGAWFGAVSGDKRKRDADVAATAERAEAKADRVAAVTERINPDEAHAGGLPPNDLDDDKTRTRGK